MPMAVITPGEPATLGNPIKSNTEMDFQPNGQGVTLLTFEFGTPPPAGWSPIIFIGSAAIATAGDISVLANNLVGSGSFMFEGLYFVVQATNTIFATDLFAGIVVTRSGANIVYTAHSFTATVPNLGYNFVTKGTGQFLVNGAAVGSTQLVETSFGVAGVQALATGQGRYYVTKACTILGAIASLGTPPTGTSFIVDVLKNGVTIYTTSGNRPTIAINGNVSATTLVTPDVTALAVGDYLTVNVAQIGSGTAGSDLTVTVRMTSP